MRIRIRTLLIFLAIAAIAAIGDTFLSGYWIILQTEKKIESGEIPPASLEETIRYFEEWDYSTNELIRIGAVQTSEYLNKLLAVAIENHPQGKYAGNFNLRVVICDDRAPDMLYTDRDISTLYLMCRGPRSQPDGTITMPLSYIMEARSEGELVATLGHEITHVLQQHFGKWLALQLYLSDHGNAAAKILFDPETEGMKLAMRGQIKADDGAVKTITRAGYNPCIYYNMGQRLGIEKVRMENLQKSAECAGREFIVDTEAEFVSLKENFGKGTY